MFAGLLTRTAELSPRDFVAFEAWRNDLSPFHRSDVDLIWQQGPALLMEAKVFNTPESHAETTTCVCLESGVALAFWGRLDNREVLVSALGLDKDRRTEPTDPQLVLAAWRRWGEALPEHLLGDFALAVLDPIRRRAFLARDPLGVKPLYYRLDSKAFIFGGTAAIFRSLKIGASVPDLDWIARHLSKSYPDHRTTGLVDVLRLPPGHSLAVDERGNGTLRCWFHWRDDAPSARRRDPYWVQTYRDTLEDAVRRRMRSRYSLGVENSGGIDSAAITAYSAYLLGEPGDRLHSFGLALCEQEPALILETSRHWRIIHNYLLTSSKEPDDALIQRSLATMGYPSEFGISYDPFYRECALRGLRTLLSGFGGDEAVTNSAQLGYREFLRDRHYMQLWDILPGNPAMRALRLAKAIATRHRSLPPYDPIFLAAWKARWSHQLLRDEVVERLSIYDGYMETARHDAPYHRINDFVIFLITHPLVSSRLESCTLMAASYGVEYRWPLWDIRLVQQYLSTPSIEKIGPRGIGRYLHRRAIDPIVPRCVAWKPTKDMGYARMSERNAPLRLAAAVKEGRRQAAHLHPALAVLIDKDKFLGQIRLAAQGNTADKEFVLSFRRNVGEIQQINQWLHGGPLD